ncbi:hypothetical protein AVEN_8094-1 [Araneus ventricosus]|uniref:Uncharacterized protein n=1 Tax=Araneus ventricosus TaxID=182803 RepID=A0A4Y2LSM0_ARAVE|nr:hypothetical protein AVEN_8094-1 [Araneus ventricosus]
MPNTPAIHKTDATVTACVTFGVLWQECLSGELTSPKERLSLLFIFPPRRKKLPFQKPIFVFSTRKKSPASSANTAILNRPGSLQALANNAKFEYRERFREN